jgi:hypothetical protein
MTEIQNLSPLANRPAASLTEMEIEAVLEAVLTDERTKSAVRAEGNKLAVVVEDTKEGILSGVYSVGRILAAMYWTEDGWRQDQEARTVRRREAEEAAALKAAERAALEARNVEWLKDRGVSVHALARIIGKIQSGIYIDDAEWQKYDFFTASFCGGEAKLDLETILRTSSPIEPEKSDA